MKSLYEHLYNSNVDNLAEPLGRAEIFNVDNVADYYFSSSQIDWPYSAFPNLALPFESAFFEYTMPKFGIFEEGINSNPMAGMKIGVLCKRHDVEKYERGFKWILESVIFMPVVGQYHFVGGSRVGIDKHGSAIDDKEDKVHQLMWAGDADVFGKENAKSIIGGLQPPVFLAISFLNCKNVKIENNEPKRLPNGRVSRHSPNITYKTLKIEPMKKVLETEGDIKHNGLKQALHICRGHFKDFSQGAGLFGRHKGLYWWDSQVRGKVENGIVIKDYSVNTPKEN